MNKGKIVAFKKLGDISEDPLTELLRSGARKLITDAVEVELQELLNQYSNVKNEYGHKQIVRNGYLPEREIQTGVGSVKVRVPKIRDKSGQGIKFNSALLPPYLRKTKSVEEVLPWLYLKGISTGDFQEALQALLGVNAAGLSSSTISRCKRIWEEEHEVWNRRSLTLKRYVYIWADGVYFNIRSDDSRQCILVIVGVTEHGKKEFVAIEDGYRESEQSWSELLLRLKAQGLGQAPKLAVGDGALGFWKALSKVYPDTVHQRCWVHKTANVLNKLPKLVQPKVKQALHEIWMAPTKEDAYKAFDVALKTYSDKYPKAMECLKKDKDEMLAFYDYPAAHWQHLRTSNPIIDDTFIKMLMSWRHISGFNVHNEVRIKPNDEKGIENLSQYIIRNTFSLGKLKYETGDYSVIYHSKMSHGKNKRNFQVFSPLEFIAAITLHIPDPYFQLARMYGWYSNRMRGDRKKQEEREGIKQEGEAAQDGKLIDIRNYKPKRIPQLMWRECIKKVWEVDPLICPKCTAEMKIISFIYKRTVIKKILTHLKIFEEKKNQRAPPMAQIDYTERVKIVPYDDGWPEYEEAVFDF